LPAIELQQLWKSYDGKPALQGLSLDAYPSEILGLIGPNGAGKTTTLKILVGLLRPDYGIVIVLMMLFRPIGLIPERRRKRELEEGVHDESMYDATHS